MRPAIRWIDGGHVSALRSQTTYHGLAHAWSAGAPDTIVLLSPAEPYVCIGFHQELETEVDIEHCRRSSLPVVRREIGGGAVYLDRDQLFLQWIMDPAHLPPRVEERFELFARPIVATYERLGIHASFRPVNDIHVSGRKIGGTGAGRIGGAEVLVGSFLFDFDCEAMSRVLKVPSEKFRDKVHRSLREYMTTMKRELGTLPPRDEVSGIYRRRCEETLAAQTVDGKLTAAELRAIEQTDQTFVSRDFLHRRGGLRRPGVKIHHDVWVRESLRKAEGGLVRVTARVRDDQIEEVALSGDFFCEGGTPHGLEEALAGVGLRRDEVEEAVRGFFRLHAVHVPGVRVEDWVAAVMGLAEAQGREGDG